MCNNTGSKMFFSFLTGAAIGAGLAVIFAPQSGKETRKQIKDFSEKLSSEVKDNVEKISEKAMDLIEGTNVEKISEKAMDFIEDTKDTFKKKPKIY